MSKNYFQKFTIIICFKIYNHNIFRGQMVKFFLRNDKNQPKQVFNHQNGNERKKNHNKQKTKPKKVLDYRIVIWKKMFNLIKTEHSLMIQKIIRKIKQTKEKLQNLNEVPESEEKKQRLTTLNKELQKLDHRYKSFKQQKKQQLKLITLYIIVQIFKIQNIEKILQKAKIQKDSFKVTDLKQAIQNNDAKKLFVEKLSRLTVYQQELENCAQLIDVVQEKKLQRKTKLKEKKMRKYEKQHQIKNSNQDEEEKENELPQIEQESSHQSGQQVQKQQIKVGKHNKQSPSHPHAEKFQHPKSDKHNLKQQNKSLNFNDKQQFTKTKPIQKQRTQFKKTGRNKVKFEKEQKKKQFKNNEFNKQLNEEKQQKKRANSKYGFTKEMAHPSWQAKQELKQQVFIKPFEGKKILL